MVADHQFEDAGLARLYDGLHPWAERDDFEFYLPRVMAAGSVLDVGCGTGMLLHRARESGHSGRLCGLDPAVGMLELARQRADVEWVLGDLATVDFDREFDLVVMTGHAFQVLLTDDDLRAALGSVRAALTDDGRFAFETRNPRVRTWEQWTPDRAVEMHLPSGTVVRMEHDVELPVTGELVSFTTTYTSATWDAPQRSHSTLRFLDADAVAAHLTAAGLTIDEQYGDWDRSAITATSPEIITLARPT
jgi:SAM-dependent methyltransferase